MTRWPWTGTSTPSARPVRDARTRRHSARRLVLLLTPMVFGLSALAWGMTRPASLGPVLPEPSRVVRGFHLPDTQGTFHTLADVADRRALVLIYLGLECPISNGLAPEMARLSKLYEPRGVQFLGIHADPDVSPDQAARHAEEFGLPFPILLDPDHDLASQVGITLTPEAAVLTPGGLVAYRGRIDDRHVRPGLARGTPTVHDLQTSLDALLASKPILVPRTRPVGCPLPKPLSASTPPAVTYQEHIAPILQRRCAGCHRPGEVGPFSLLTYRDAAKRADFLRDITQDRRMPPWKPEPGFGTFQDDPRLNDRELALIAAWADAGAPEGPPSPRPIPPPPPDGWQLGKPDVVFTMPEAFPVPPGPDLYRAFVIPNPPGGPLSIRAIEFRPGNRRIVHHAKLFCDPTRESSKRDRADPAPGFASLGSADLGVPALWEWTPGTTPRPYPSGVGTVLRPGGDLVLYIHYHPSGKPEQDQSQVGLYLSNEPPTWLMAGIPLGTTKIDIPAGARHQEVHVSTITPVDLHAHAVMPHAHFLLREMKVRAILPDGRVRRLLWISDWDFNWQGQYRFADPVALPKGTRIDLVGIYDNSDNNPRNPFRPAQRVRFGPTSFEEMLGCHIQVIPDRQEDYPALRQKWRSGL